MRLRNKISHLAKNFIIYINVIVFDLAERGFVWIWVGGTGGGVHSLDKKEPQSIIPSLEPFERQLCENMQEVEWSAYLLP